MAITPNVTSPITGGNFSGSYIPSKWAKKLIAAYQTRLFLNHIANTDYEGEIKDSGDVVKIRRAPEIAVRDYLARQDLTIDELEGDVISLEINRGKYFAFNVEDIEKHQSDVDFVNKAMEDAAMNIKKGVEKDFLLGVRADAATENMGAAAGASSGAYNLGTDDTPFQITKDNAVDLIVDFGSVLDEQDVPEQGRWLVIPPLVANRLKKSELKQVYVTGDAKSALRTGNIGMIDRFNVFVSNMFTAEEGGKYYPIFGHKDALTFASQLVKNEVVPREKRFGKIHRGLAVYGYEVVRPEAFGVSCVISA